MTLREDWCVQPPTASSFGSDPWPHLPQSSNMSGPRPHPSYLCSGERTNVPRCPHPSYLCSGERTNVPRRPHPSYLCSGAGRTNVLPHTWSDDQQSRVSSITCHQHGVLSTQNGGGATQWRERDTLDLWSVLDPQLFIEPVPNPDRSMDVEQADRVASYREGASECTSTSPVAQYAPDEQVSSASSPSPSPRASPLPSPSPSTPPTPPYSLPDWHRDIEALRAARCIPSESSGFWSWLCADMECLARDLDESGLTNTNTNTDTNTDTDTDISTHPTSIPPRIRLGQPTSGARSCQDVAGIPLGQNTPGGGNESGGGSTIGASTMRASTIGASTVPSPHDHFEDASGNPDVGANGKRLPNTHEHIYDAYSSASSPSIEDATTTLSTRDEDLEMSDDAESQSENWESESWNGSSD